MSVVVTTAGEPERRASGFHGIGELTTLRAPLDATLDPAARRKGADAGDLLTFAREESLRAPAPPGDLFLHVAVALEEEDASPATRVRVTGEALDLRETLAEGTSQSRGPRLVAEIAARLAGTSRLELDLACPTTSEPPPAPEASSPSRSWMDAVLLALAAIGLAFALGAVVWRRLRRG